MPMNLPAAVYRLQLWFSRVGKNTMAAEQAVQQRLSPSEQKRLRQISHVKKRREYLLSRSLMRHALGETFGLPTGAWDFREQRAAAPRPEPLPEGTWLSLSHSGGYICFAIANCPVGVDIEIVKRDRDYRASAEFFMNSAERAQLAAAGNAQAEFFYRAWCAKEAWYKGLAAAVQAQTTLRSIHYTEVRSGRGGRRLVEGHGDDFRLAAVIDEGVLQLEQNHYLAPVQVAIEDRIRG